MSKPLALSLVRPAAIALALSTPAAVSLEFQKFLAGASGSSLERSLLVDASRPIAYVGYADRIVRLDYATWPPVEMTATTADVHADWPNRTSLTYA